MEQYSTTARFVKVKEANNSYASEWVTLNVSISGNNQVLPNKGKSVARL